MLEEWSEGRGRAKQIEGSSIYDSPLNSSQVRYSFAPHSLTVLGNMWEWQAQLQMEMAIQSAGIRLLDQFLNGLFTVRINWLP